MSRNRWVFLAAALLVAGIGYGGYSLFLAPGNYITVTEAKLQAESLNGQKVRVGGRIDPASIRWNAGERIIRFQLIDHNEKLEVVYKGLVPESFKPGADMIVDGNYIGNELQAQSFRPASVCSLCHS